MIDIDIAEIKMLPRSHIALQDYNGIIELEKKNKALKSIIFIIVSVGLLIITYKIITNEKSDKPRTSKNQEN